VQQALQQKNLLLRIQIHETSWNRTELNCPQNAVVVPRRTKERRPPETPGFPSSFSQFPFPFPNLLPLQIATRGDHNKLLVMRGW
jgi:hypothetical protein